MTAATVPSRWDAVRTRNGASYFATQTISTIGTFMQSFAQTWLVLTLTGNRSSLPLSIALQTLPLLLLGTYGGTVADRFDNRKLLIAASLVNTAFAVAFGVFVQTDRTSLLAVYAFSLLGGLVAVVERPATQAFLSEVVSPERVQSAVGLNSMIFPTARLVGPVLSGLAIGTVGLAWCFYLNAVTFVVFSIALAGLRRSEMFERRTMPSRKGMAAAGLRYAREDPVVGRALLVMMFVGFAGYNFMAAIPLMGKYTFNLDEQGLVPTMAVSAIGALIAGLVAAGFAVANLRRQGLAALLFGVTLIVYGAAPTALWWAVLSFPLGIASTAFQVVTTTALQRTARPDMLGRVMALNSIGLIGTTPLGMVFVAWLSTSFGTRSPFLVGGVVVAAVAMLTLTRPPRRVHSPTTA